MFNLLLIAYHVIIFNFISNVHWIISPLPLIIDLAFQFILDIIVKSLEYYLNVYC